MILSSKIFKAAAVAGALAGCAVAATPAEARWGGHGWGGGYYGGWGPGYGWGYPGYGYGAPYYYDEEPIVVHRYHVVRNHYCRIVRRQVQTAYGWRWRRVRYCTR